MAQQRSTSTRSPREYVALSTLNEQFGWNIYARGADRAQVTAEAEMEIDRTSGNLFDDYRNVNLRTDTLLKNLSVVSLTCARRLVGKHKLGECFCCPAYSVE